jgi:hypothetical protein
VPCFDRDDSAVFELEAAAFELGRLRLPCVFLRPFCGVEKPVFRNAWRGEAIESQKRLGAVSKQQILRLRLSR